MISGVIVPISRLIHKPIDQLNESIEIDKEMPVNNSKGSQNVVLDPVH